MRIKFLRSFICLLLILLFAAMGVLSRKYDQILPTFVVKYAGDTFWASAAYFLVRFIYGKATILKTLVITYIFQL